MINYNGRTVTLKLTRREVCELLLACSCCGAVAEEVASVEMWRRIHDKVNEQLNEFDEKNYKVEHGYAYYDCACEIENDLKQIPSAQPEQTKMIKEIREWINSRNRGSADYFIVDKIEEIINKYE